MTILITKKGEDFYLHFNDASFTAIPSGVCVLLNKDELDKLVFQGNAELQDMEVLSGC